MECGLAIDVGTVDVDFVVVQKCNYIVDVAMLNGMEQDVVSDLLHSPYHFITLYYNLYNLNFIKPF